jgi:hypothetical protein
VKVTTPVLETKSRAPVKETPAKESPADEAPAKEARVAQIGMSTHVMKGGRWLRRLFKNATNRCWTIW